RADERWLLRRRLCFRFHSLVRSPPEHRRVSTDAARTTLRRQSRTRDLALPGNLSASSRRDRSSKEQRAKGQVFQRNCGNRAEKRERHNRALSSPDWAIRILPATGVLSLHRIPESDFPANGL